MPRLKDVIKLRPGLVIDPDDFIVFIDETGLEDFSDSSQHVFGLGGCAVLGSDYDEVIRLPWKDLKKRCLGPGPFHAATAVFRKEHYSDILAFVQRPFWRFAVLSDRSTAFASGFDANGGVLFTLHALIWKLVRDLNVKKVYLVFENSQRRDELVYQDLSRIGEARQFYNASDLLIPCDVCFQSKQDEEPGLEVADLLVHTAQRQGNSQVRAGKRDAEAILPDFRATFTEMSNFTHYIHLQELRSSAQPPDETLVPTPVPSLNSV